MPTDQSTPSAPGIDPSSVTWDQPARAQATSIDPAHVTWDATPAQSASASTSEEAQKPEPGLAQQLVGAGKELGRQVGLTARYGLEGLGQAAEVVTEPIRKLVTDPAMRALGAQEGRPLGQTAADLADTIGLPTPRDSTERVVGDATRFLAGGAGMAGAAGKVAQLAKPGMLQSAAQTLAANPAEQMVGAVGTGAGAGVSREAGGNDAMQLGAGLAGGLTLGGLMQAARSGVRSASVLLPARTQRMEQQIGQALDQAGVNWAEVPESLRQGLRAEVEQALGTGQTLDPGAVSRLLDFQRVGATPTRGMLSLDPVQITREQNLARMGANASDTGLHGLARVQNENNAALIDSLNRLGAGGAGDAHAVGTQAIDTLQRGLDADRAAVGALYSQARDSAGRSFPLDGSAFTSRANSMLDEALLGSALPPSVGQHLNRIAAGEVPFTVDYAEQLKTAMGQLQRASSDGPTRMALGLVRQALDETPVLGLGQGSPAAGVQVGEQAVEAFNRARLANRDMMQRVEAIPGLKAVYEGTAAPDDFVQRYVISRGAKVEDTGRLASELRRSDPQSLQAVRGSIAAHLKTAAIGAAADETGKFSASGYNRALLALGSRKLAQFFSKQEVAQLKAVGRVAQFATAQPVGSAVNNSNSGALLAGRGLDLLDRLASKVPLLGLGPTVSGFARNVQQRQAQNIAPALVRKPLPPPRGLPAVTLGTLMASQGESGAMTATVEITSTQRIYDAVVDLHALEQIATRETVAELTGLKLTVVDDRLRALVDDGKLKRLLRGIYAPVETHPPARDISKTILSDGSVKIEIGDEVLTLTPREDRMLASLMAGTAAQAIAIQTGYTMAQLSSDLHVLLRESGFAVKARR